MIDSQELLGSLKLAMAHYAYPATASADPAGLSKELNALPWLEPLEGKNYVWVANQLLHVPGRVYITPSIVTVTGFETQKQGRDGDTLTELQHLITSYGYRV